jgi:hypothetical protein
MILRVYVNELLMRSKFLKLTNNSKAPLERGLGNSTPERSSYPACPNVAD